MLLISLPDGLPLSTVSLQNEADSTQQGGDAATQATGEGTEEQVSPPSGLMSSFLVPAVAIFAIFYFVLIRPERKKQAERQSMMQSIKKGTKVMTTSGLYGSVAQVKDDVITLQVADGVRLRFNRAAIQDVLDGKENAKSEAGKDASDSDGEGGKDEDKKSAAGERSKEKAGAS